jgi:hypothetical protein
MIKKTEGFFFHFHPYICSLTNPPKNMASAPMGASGLRFFGPPPDKRSREKKADPLRWPKEFPKPYFYLVGGFNHLEKY